MNTSEIRTGMTVYSADGEKLGKIVEGDASSIVVEKGFFFPKDYTIAQSDIREVRGDEVYLSLTKERLTGEAPAGSAEPAREERHDMPRGHSGAAFASTEEQRIPVVEEELAVERQQRKAGEVRVRKEVTTETQNVSVPVTREQVHVERVPVEGKSLSEAEVSGAFEDKELRVPIVEEEVEIRKRPVVREEVRIGKERHQEQLSASEQVRREHVDIDEEGDVRRAGTRGSEDESGLGAPSRHDDPLRRR
jgi:uncharacterized protein (TIGR02271 family)